MKIRKLFLAAGLTAVMVMAGCGQDAAEEKNLEQETEQVEETEQESGVEDAQTDAEAADSGQTEEESGAQEETEGGAEGQLYEDNFAVDEDAVVDFGEKIQEAVAAKDMEALADLTAYPLYVGFADGGESVESREEFVALGAERIFTPELLEAVGNADPGSLSPSMAGFVLSADGRPNIVFSVVNGSLAIQGINY